MHGTDTSVATCGSSPYSSFETVWSAVYCKYANIEGELKLETRLLICSLVVCENETVENYDALARVDFVHATFTQQIT